MNLRRALAAVTFIALLPALYAATLPPSGAILSPTAGVVAVNGHPITSGTFVANRDWIATGPFASASLTLPGASLLAAANTSFRLESSGILLRSGLVDVSGHLPIAVASATVVPSRAGAEFRIEAVSGVAYLDVLSGSVAIQSPKSSYTVPAGTSVALGNAQQLPAPVAMKSCLTPMEAFGITAAAAAGAGAFAYFYTRTCHGSSCMVSPTTP